MEKLHVKLTSSDGDVFTQDLPAGVLRMDGEKLDVKATRKAIDKRVKDEDDPLDYGDLAFDVIGEDERSAIVAENEAKQAKLAEEAEAAANTPGAIEYREFLSERKAKQAADLAAEFEDWKAFKGNNGKRAPNE